MATYTTHYNLKKPAPTDTTEIITDLNANYDTIDTALYGKASTTHGSTHKGDGADAIDTATTTVNGLMSSTDKKKLDDATATDIASTLVMRDTNKRAKFADPLDSQDAATKKYVDDGLSPKANKVSSPTENNFAGLTSDGDLQDSGKKATDFAESTHATTHITGGSDVISDAVAGGNSGLMSGADKKKLDDATATDIASTLVMRDTNKRAKFADPAENQDAATKKYVDDNLSGKVDKVAEAVEDNIAVLDENGNIKDSGEKTSDFVRTLFEEVIIGEDWEGDEPPYTQEITLEGITADNRPIVSPLYDDDLEVAIAQQEAWSLIDKIVTDINKIICYCFTDKPEVAIDIQLWVV